MTPAGEDSRMSWAAMNCAEPAKTTEDIACAVPCESPADSASRP